MDEVAFEDHELVLDRLIHRGQGSDVLILIVKAHGSSAEGSQYDGIPKLNFRPDFRISRHSFDVVTKCSPAFYIPGRCFVREKPVLGPHKITVEVGAVVEELSGLGYSAPENRRDDSFLYQ